MDESLLLLTSVYMNKSHDFLLNIFKKFYRCYSTIEYRAKDKFNKDHYYIFVYLICLFKDNKTLNNDQILILIYILYSNIIDDDTSRSSYIYPALKEYSNGDFDNLLLQVNSKLFGHIFKICNNDSFLASWKPKCFRILAGIETFDEKFNENRFKFNHFTVSKLLVY